MALVPTLTGSPGIPRFRRGGRQRSEKPVQENISSQEGIGKWIWIANPDPVSNSYIQARKSFTLPAKPTSAIIKACADSRYKLFVNGRYVGKGPVRSGEGYCYFDTFNVAELLDKGDNVIAVLAHHVGESTYNSAPGKPGLICKVEIEADGKTQLLGTNETWKVRQATEWVSIGARLNHRLGFQEIYDAEDAPDGWTEIKFKEKDWQYAVEVGIPPALPWGELKAREIPPLREETILPRAVVTRGNAAEIGRESPAASMPDIMASFDLVPLKSGSAKNAEMLLTDSGVTDIKTPRGDKGVAIVLDFGREVFGNVEIGLGPTGSGCIDIGYSEALTDGQVRPNAGMTRYTDRILMKKGRLNWESFEPRAFRFIRIEFRRCSRQVPLEYVRVNQTTYPVRQTGSFECDDRVLNDIWQAGVYTAQLCMEDTFIECPWRERAQWWGDARILARTAYYAFDDTALLAQGLRQIASSQVGDGSILGLYPAGEHMLVPDFALVWVFSILDYYAFADDAQLVHDLYPAVARLLKWFARYENDSGLLSGVPGRLLIDKADLERTGEVTSLNCFYHQALRVASALASISEKPEEAQKYIDTAIRLRVAINKYMYVAKRGLYAECRKDGELVEKFSRQTNILAALFDVTDQYQKLGIFRQLSNGGLPELGTPYFASYYLEALYSADHHEQALDIIRRKWGEMVRGGVNTLWEDFSPNYSLCHGSSVCPSRDLIAEIVGIKPVPGTHRFAVTPHPANLKWARGSINTKSGPLMVDWRVFRNRLDISVEAPEGLKVDVYPPGPVDSTITVDGKHWPSRFVTLSAGRHIVRVTQPRQQKIAAYDDLPALGLAGHVELLDRGVRIGRRGVEIEPRRRSKRDVKPKEPLEVTMLDVEIIGEEPEVEVERVLVTESVEEAQSTKRRRRTRGGRGRKPSTSEPAVADVVQEETPTPEPATESIEAIAPESGGETPEKKRRRRPRGGRGRGRSSMTEPASATETPEQPIETPEPAIMHPEPVVGEPVGKHPELVEGEPIEGAPVERTPVGYMSENAGEAPPMLKRRRRSRGGRGRSRSTSSEQAITDSPQVESPLPKPIAEPTHSEEAQPESMEQKSRRRRSRGGRGRRLPTSSELTISDSPQVETTSPESKVERLPVEEPQTESSEQKSRRRRPRGGRGRNKSVNAEHINPDSPQVETPALEHSVESTPASEPQQLNSSEEPAKRKRRTYTRRRAPRDVTTSEGNPGPP